jgi:uncharacterized protein
MGDPPRDFLVMAKPCGPECNLRCGYCYYVGNQAALACGPGTMSEELLEEFDRQRLASAPGPLVHFEWHGGEPTLAGLGFFERVIALQRCHRVRGKKATNGLQTNGLLLDGAWLDFLSREGFSVGLSLDGPSRVHDRYRLTSRGGATQARVEEVYGALEARGVFCNLLCVLHEGNAGDPDGVYEYFRRLGARYLQFLPLVTPLDRGGPQAAAATPEALGDFLCRVFDRWLAQDVGRIVVQAFDEALRPLYGLPHALCVHRETCGDALVLERNGDLFACDHFVDAAHRVGSLRERGLAELVADPRLAAFGKAKRDSLPTACLECELLSFCNGGCPKDRIVEAGEIGRKLNYLCPAYKAFFGHAREGLAKLAAHMKTGRPLRSFEA